MENPLPTQPTSNETDYMKSKKKIKNTIKDNLNYIYIVLMIIANILISLLKIEDGYIGLRYPTSLLGWVLWIAQILIQTFIGVMILNAFRRQGIKNGHDSIKDTYNEYIKAITSNNKFTNPRSLKQYMRVQGTKDSLSKAFVYVIVGMFVGSVVISANLNNILSLVTNIIFAIGFGIKAMLDAEEFVLTELVIWYQLKIAEVTAQKLEPAQENKKDGSKQGNNKRRSRSSSTNRVQSTKECSTRPKIVDNNEPSQSTS